MNAITTLHARRAVSIRPVSTIGLTTFSGDRRATHAMAYGNYLYITRQAGRDPLGPLDYRHRDDLVAHGLELPANHPRWAEEDGGIWREIDGATADLAPDAVRAWHVVVTLPADGDADEWIRLVRGYAQDTIARHGPGVAWAIHARPDGDSGWNVPPHAHVLITTRVWRHEARHGRRCRRGAARPCRPVCTPIGWRGYRQTCVQPPRRLTEPAATRPRIPTALR